MKKLGLFIFIAMTALFLSACGASEKEEILEVHEGLHDLTEGTEDKMEEVQGVFMEYVTGAIDETEYNKKKDEFTTYISEKKDEFNDIKKPKKELAVEYYDMSKKVLMGSYDMIESILDVPDLTDEQAAMEYSENLEKQVSEVESDIQDVEDFQNKLKEEDDDYKEAFKDEE